MVDGARVAPGVGAGVAPTVGAGVTVVVVGVGVDSVTVGPGVSTGPAVVAPEVGAGVAVKTRAGVPAAVGMGARVPPAGTACANGQHVRTECVGAVGIEKKYRSIAAHNHADRVEVYRNDSMHPSCWQT